MMLNSSLIHQAVDASAKVSEAKEVTVVGTGAAVLAVAEDAERILRETEAIDVILTSAAGGGPDTRRGESVATQAVNKLLGRGSRFHRQHGVCVRRLGPWANPHPGVGRRDEWQAWHSSVSGKTYRRPTLAQVAYGKLTLGRPKDTTYVGTLLTQGLVNGNELRELIGRETISERRLRGAQTLQMAEEFRSFRNKLESLRTSKPSLESDPAVALDRFISDYTKVNGMLGVRSSQIRLEARNYVEGKTERRTHAASLFEKLIAHRTNQASHNLLTKELKPTPRMRVGGA